MASQDYARNIYKNNRRTVAEVTYSLTAPDSKYGGQLSLPSGNEFSRADQVINEIHEMTAPVATLEPDYWRLDGSFVLPLQDGLEVGWWSNESSNANGVLPRPLVIERVFNAVQSFHTLGITFDPATGNCCSELEVQFFSASGQLVYSERISDNNDTYIRTSKAGNNILRVVITLFKTNKPFRFARVTELDFGLTIIYGVKDILSLNMIRESDLSGRCFAIPELRLRVVNRGEYDQLDTSSYAPYFQTRQRFQYRHGLELSDGSVEWVDCGSTYLTGWNVSDRAVEFRTGGKSALSFNSVYYGSSFNRITVAQLVRRVFPNAVISLDSPAVTAYFGNLDYRRVLNILSELSCCLVFEDGANRLCFKDILYMSRNYRAIDTEGFVLHDADGYELYILGAPDSADGVVYGNTLTKPKAALSEYYNAISLAEYEPTVERRVVSRTNHQPGEIIIHFSAPVTGEPEIEVSEGFELRKPVFYTMYMTAELHGEGEAEVTITGDQVSLVRSETVYHAPWHTGREPDNTYSVDLPCMIKTEGYQVFRDWFLARRFALLAYRLSCDVRWLNNPEVDVGDLVSVQLNSAGAQADMWIVRQELNYNGALTGSIRAVGQARMR